MSGVLEIFLQRPTIALLLHRISHVAHCVYILTKALLLFTLLLKMAYVELTVGKWKHALVSHILQNQTKDPWRWQITQAGQDRAHMWKVDDGMKWSTPFMNLSLLYLDIMRSWLYYCISLFFSWNLMCPIFFLLFFWVMLLGHAIFFFDSPCLIWRILEREREIIKPGVLFCGWMNGINDL